MSFLLKDFHHENDDDNDDGCDDDDDDGDDDYVKYNYLGIGFMAHADPLGTVPSVTYVPLK